MVLLLTVPDEVFPLRIKANFFLKLFQKTKSLDFRSGRSCLGGCFGNASLLYC